MSQSQKPKCVSVPLHILWDDRLSSTEKLIWADINTFDVCFKSQSTIAEQFGVSRQWVNKCLKHLLDLGYIEVVEHTDSVNIIRAVMDAPEVSTNDETLSTKMHRGCQQKCTTLTEEKTGVGDITYEIEESSIITPPTPQRGASAKATMQALVRVFKHRGMYDHRKAELGVAALLKAFDGDSESIIEGARAATKQKPFVRKDGTEWRPNFLWFTSPDNTDKVVTWLEHRAMEDSEEKEIPEGLREQYDVAIELGEAHDYNECAENWGMILPKIISTPEYRRLTDGR